MKNLIFLLSLVCILSCASPQKHFKKGNYEKAYTECLKDLKGGKKDRKLKTLLNKSFNELLKANRADSESLLSSNHIEDWDLAYAKNEALISHYQNGKTYLDEDFDGTLAIVESENEKLLDDIVEAYLEFGNEQFAIFEDTGDKISAQDAFLMFDKVASYNHPNAPSNLNELMQKSLEGGTVFVLVTADTWESRYQWDIDREFRNIENESQNFYQIVFEGNIQNPDCVLEIEFNRLDIDRRDRSRTERFSEEIEDGYRVEKDTSGRETRIPLYKTVTGQVQIIEENYEFRWDARVSISQLSNYCDFRNRTFTFREDIEIENYEWSGDERAIPSGYRTSRRNELTSNDERNIIDDLIEDAYDEIRRYYF